MFRSFIRWALPGVVALLASIAPPVSAQMINTAPQALPFPVLAGSSFTIDPTIAGASDLFSVTEGALNLRTDSHGWIDMEPYCQVPDRHWGPVSVISCTLEMPGSPAQTGLSLSSRVPLDHLGAGSTITLRFLVQAPLIILDLEGNPTAVMDTFLEEYHWNIVGRQ